MRGDLVIVRAYGNRALVKRVWSIGAGSIFVTSDEVYEKMAKGLTDLIPIGFPVQDVFKYDSELAEGSSGKIDWSKLSRYQ